MPTYVTQLAAFTALSAHWRTLRAELDAGGLTPVAAEWWANRLEARIEFYAELFGEDPADVRLALAEQFGPVP